jgi:tRNA(Ile)-lysidine synthase
MIEKLVCILQESKIAKKDSILIAFSGGMDSTVLSSALLELGYSISLAHVNFQLRGEASTDDANFCRNFAETKNLPYHHRLCDTEKFANEQKLSIQEAARELRYAFFSELQKEYNFKAIFTAHHADDNLETFLINFTRSGGLKGLKGIPLKRQFYLRPLLAISRQDLKDYANSKNITWREDASNQSLKYLRNKYRLELIPKWIDIEPDLIKKSSHSIALLKEQNSAFQSLLQEKLEEHLTVTPAEEALKTEALKGREYWSSLLRFWLKAKGNWDFHSLENLWSTESGKTLENQYYWIIHKNGSYRLSIKAQKYSPKNFEIERSTKAMAGLIFSEIAPQDFPEKPDPSLAFLDLDKLTFPLYLRPWKAGDRFKPLGLSGTKKVSDYLNDIKIIGPEKKKQLVLCNGTDIIWLVGSRIDHRYRVTNSTKTIYFVSTL